MSVLIKGGRVVTVVSTDHCPFRWGDQKTLGREDFSRIPNGGPGIENRLHMLHHFGVREGRLTMNQLVDLCCTQPARLFGLFPRKGTIAAGADADIVVWDSEKPLTLSASTTTRTSTTTCSREPRSSGRPSW